MSCDKNKKNAQIILENDEIKQEQQNENRGIPDYNATLNAALFKKYGHTEISGKELIEVATSIYPKDFKKREHMLFVHGIQGLLDANRGIGPMVMDMIRMKITDKRYSGKLAVTEQEDNDGNLIHKIDNLDELETATLAVIYKQTINIVNAVVGKKRGIWQNFGGVMVQLKTPKKQARGDKTGAFREIAKGTSVYADNIARRIGLFITNANDLNDEMKEIFKAQGLQWDNKRDKVELSMTDINNIIGGISLRKLTDINGNEIISEVGVRNNEDKVQTIFQGIMKGWIRIGDGKTYIAISDGHTPTKAQLKANPQDYIKLEKNEFYISKDFTHVVDEDATKENNGMTTFARWPDKSRVRKFQNLVKLKEFTPPNGGKKGQWYVGFDETQLEELKTILSEARKIDNHAHTYMAYHMPKSVDNLVKELSSLLNNKFNAKEIQTLFFQEFDETSGTITRIIDGEKITVVVTEDDVKTINALKETFAMNIQNDFVIPDGGKTFLDKSEKDSFMTNHWPSLFDRQKLQTMMSQMLGRTQSELEAFTKSVGLVYDDKKFMYVPNKNNKWRNFEKKRKKAALTHIERLQEKIASLKKVQSEMAGIPINDGHINALVPLMGNNKYFKRITGAYDLRNARMDKGVYYDYLKNMMGTLERNALTGSLIKSFKLLQNAEIAGDIDAVHKRVVMETAINLYKVPFATTSLKGPFGITMEGFVKPLNFIYGFKPGKVIKRTPEQIQQTLRTMASGLTAIYLGGPGSAITNYSGMFQNIIDYGYVTMRDAQKLMKSTKLLPKRDAAGNLVMEEDSWGIKQIVYSNVTVGERIKQIIEQSGLVNFNEFFSQSMVNGIANAALERNTHEAVVTAMIAYHAGKLKAGKNIAQIAKLKAKLNERVNKALNNSKNFIDATELIRNEITQDSKESIEKYEARLKQLRKDRRKDVANAYVQFAINKESEFSEVIRKTGGSKEWLNKLGDMSLDKMSKGMDAWGTLLKKFNLTMGETESYVRSVSFIIGATRAHNANQLLGGQDMEWYEYKNKDFISDVIEWGKEFSNFTNFGLSTQDVGSFNYNGLGNLMGKFKYWSQQKFGRDIETWQEGYYSVVDFENMDKNGFQFKTVYKMFKTMVRFDKMSTEKLREVNPAMAQLRTHALMQGAITMFWDTMLFGLPIPGMSSLRAYLFGQSGILGIKSTRALKSDLISLFMFPFTLAAKMALMGDWDDEDFEFSLTYFMRMSFLGYLPMKGYDLIIAMMYFMTGNERKVVDKTVDFLQAPLGGRTSPGQIFLQPAAKSLLTKAFIDDEDI